jgi:hypothetical protein
MVSIVTPLYNSAKYIGDTIESVQSQIYSHWELIVVDDGSTDGSTDMVRQFQAKDNRIRLICLDANRGPAVARNTGIEAARGRYIVFLDSDDIWFPHLLETELAYMNQKNAAIVFASYERAGEDLKTNIGPFIVPREVRYRDLLKTCSISCLTGMYDTEKVGKVYMPDFYKREDYGVWLAILKQGYTAWGIQEPLALYRIRETSVSRNKLLVATQQWKYYRTEEKLSLPESAYYFGWYVASSIKKYII